jgi:hypothetical protein
VKSGEQKRKNVKLSKNMELLKTNISKSSNFNEGYAQYVNGTNATVACRWITVTKQKPFEDYCAIGATDR